MDINDDLLHFSNMIAGCESINSVLKNGGKLSYEGRYAQTVLRLHAEDAGHVVGTEGFLDSIKKGATKVKDWIMKILKAIKDWLSGTLKGATQMFAKYFLDPTAEINAIASTTILNPLRNVLQTYESFVEDRNNDSIGLAVNNVLKTNMLIVRAIQELEKGDKANTKILWGNITTILKHIDEDVQELARRADTAAAKIPADLSHPDYDEASKKAMTITSMGKDLVSAANSFTSSMLSLKNKTESLNGSKKDD